MNCTPKVGRKNLTFWGAFLMALIYKDKLDIYQPRKRFWKSPSQLKFRKLKGEGKSHSDELPISVSLSVYYKIKYSI